MSVQLRNVMQCPACGFKTTELMPREGKVMAYVCPACQVETLARSEECCIFCKLGRLSCPPRQLSESND